MLLMLGLAMALPLYLTDINSFRALERVMGIPAAFYVIKSDFAEFLAIC